MSGSDQHNRVTLESVDDQATIGGIINRNILDIEYSERQVVLRWAHDRRRMVGQYTEHSSTLQTMCEYPAHTIMVLVEMFYLHLGQVLPLQSDDTGMDIQIRAL